MSYQPVDPGNGSRAGGKRPRAADRHDDGDDHDVDDIIDAQSPGRGEGKVEPNAKVARSSLSILPGCTCSKGNGDRVPEQKQLPLAPRLNDYIAEGGTLRYRPHPEWYPHRSAAVAASMSSVPNFLDGFDHTNGDSKPRATFGKDCDSALHMAVRQNATAAALELIRRGAFVDAVNSKGVTPLILAAQKGNWTVSAALLRRGAAVSATSLNGSTAVLQAAHFGHGPLLEMLLAAGGGRLLELANYNHTTPLMRAAQEGHLPVVKLLLERGAAVNRRNRVQMTALMLASQRGHASICRLLIDAGAELDARTSQDSTSLVLACKRRNLQVVRTLVTAGCELHVPDARGRTARQVAQRRGLSELVDLLDSSVQVHLMQHSSRSKRHWEMIRHFHLLQRERATVDVLDENGEPVSESIHDIRASLVSVSPPSSGREEERHHRHHRRPYSLLHKDESNQALLRAMALLPAPLVECVAEYLPVPFLWEERIAMLSKRSMIHSNATVTAALDLIDEVLEEGGLLEACDRAEVTPPGHFLTWCEFKAWSRRHCRVVVEAPTEDPGAEAVAAAAPPLVLADLGGEDADEDDDENNNNVNDNNNHNRVAERNITLATVPAPRNPVAPTFVELRRQAAYLSLLTSRTGGVSSLLARILAARPFCMPRPLIQQLVTTADVASIGRRILCPSLEAVAAAGGGGDGAGAAAAADVVGIRFEATAAMDLVMLASRLVSWYWRERDASRRFHD